MKSEFRSHAPLFYQRRVSHLARCFYERLAPFEKTAVVD